MKTLKRAQQAGASVRSGGQHLFAGVGKLFGGVVTGLNARHYQLKAIFGACAPQSGEQQHGLYGIDNGRGVECVVTETKITLKWRAHLC